MKFIFTAKDPGFDSGLTYKTTSVEFSTLDVKEVLREFELFLKGCGFTFDGKIKIEEKGDADKQMKLFEDKEQISIYYDTRTANLDPIEIKHSDFFYDTDRNK